MLPGISITSSVRLLVRQFVHLSVCRAVPSAHPFVLNFFSQITEMNETRGETRTRYTATKLVSLTIIDLV